VVDTDVLDEHPGDRIGLHRSVFATAFLGTE